ncbi:aminotransferase class I/II-fold pyridoxal phosphate-dependent enzyme [Leucobacter japonicus]|uniref:aminotransferase class I/II-fold pyridoxal phosphate-dependent enzyme n=1 Tax=Leucobacter japonicus TaxID=1461259 RepID=UPI0009498F84|nr:aminotransferase class I/II-fold pyridoxal phosphate-dependent enzyme [Leucobacter japonicus]
MLHSVLTVAPRFALDHSRAPYADALEAHVARGPVQLMVPGHGGTEEDLSGRLAQFLGERALHLDIPMLIDGVDLAAPGQTVTPLDEALALAADAWGAKRTWFLTNGASQANRTIALAARGLGDRILAQRSAHSSFSDGILLAGITPSYVMPNVDAEHGMAHGVSPAALDAALTDAERQGTPAHAVYVISPSYFGSVADVRGLAEVAHAHGAPLIVDGAWGPHFGFHPELPESPARLGADVVISSTHKLAGSLTQSAMLHLGHGPFADRLEPLIERAFSMTASTSTSALLRGSLDIARHALATGEEAIGRSVAGARRFREILRADARFSIVSDTFDRFADIVDTDLLRVPINVSGAGVTGHWLRQHLIEQHEIFFEMSTATSIVAVIGAGKSFDFDAVYRAMVASVESPEADIERRATGDAHDFPNLPKPGAYRVSPRDGFFGETEVVSAAEAIGRVSADTLAAYPPGIPNVMPGEEITEEAVAFLQAVAASPTGYVRGAIDPKIDRFRVLRG